MTRHTKLVNSKDPKKPFDSPIGILWLLGAVATLALIAMVTSYFVPKEVIQTIGGHIPESVAWGFAIILVVGFSLVPVFKYMAPRWLAIAGLPCMLSWILVPFMMVKFQQIILAAVGISAIGYLITAIARDIFHKYKS